MARVHWWSYLVNEEGQPIEGADISIYLAGTTTAANIFTGESGGTANNTTPQVSTNEDGFFEFWIANNSEASGYDYSQKFKVKWETTGVADGEIDNINVFPAAEEVDETDTTTVKNKMVSNSLAKNWEDHRISTYSSEPHGIEPVDETDTNTTKNKVVSNNLLKSIFDSLGSATSLYSTSVSSWTSDGDLYYADITHNLAQSNPSVSLFDDSSNQQIIPAKIDPTSNNIVRIWLASEENITVSVIG